MINSDLVLGGGMLLVFIILPISYYLIRFLISLFKGILQSINLKRGKKDMFQIIQYFKNNLRTPYIVYSDMRPKMIIKVNFLGSQEIKKTLLCKEKEEINAIVFWRVREDETDVSFMTLKRKFFIFKQHDVIACSLDINYHSLMDRISENGISCLLDECFREISYQNNINEEIKASKEENKRINEERKARDEKIKEMEYI